MHFVRFAAFFAVACLLTAGFVVAQPGPASVSNGQTAEQVYKNIQVLKGTPADQLMPSMQFISTALGVHCEHCHVEGAFDKDDKKPKQQARQMIKMMAELNHDDFSGQRGITCYSCHRGALRPRRTPPVTNEPVRAISASVQAVQPSADATAILDRYQQAVGGVEALIKVSTQTEDGVMELATGSQYPIQVSLKNPGKRSVAIKFSTGQSVEVLNGDAGWSQVPGRPLHPMSAAEVQAAKMGADPGFIARVKSSFTEFQIRPDIMIDGRAVTAIRASNPNMPPLRLYFDKQSGLLVRMVRYVDSPLGRNPTQIDYSDYRNVAGIMQPFHWTVAQPQGRYSVQLNAIQVNVPVDESRFAKPDATSASQGH